MSENAFRYGANPRVFIRVMNDEDVIDLTKQEDGVYSLNPTKETNNRKRLGVKFRRKLFGS